jgi:hypothetical protein
MTIRRGEEWGRPVVRPADLRRAESDAELAEWVAAGRPGEYGLCAGDLHRSVGAPPDRSEMRRLPCDAMRVVTDTGEWIAVAHVVARRSWWRGPIVAVMNADHIGDWNVAPRAHPDDGRLDVVEVSPAMAMRDRLQARSRLAAGTHLPHPSIATRSTERAEWDFGRRLRLHIDGVDRGSSRRLSVEVLPDHFAIVV